MEKTMTLNWEELYQINYEGLNQNTKNIDEENVKQIIEDFDKTINPNHTEDMNRITKVKIFENEFETIKVYPEDIKEEDSKIITYQYEHVIKPGQYLKILHYQLKPHSTLEELAVIYYGPNFPRLIDKRYNLEKGTCKINNKLEMTLNNKQKQILCFELKKIIEDMKTNEIENNFGPSYQRIIR